MNNLETWTKYDTYFIIVSCVISFILIGFGLMRYSNVLVKFIFFGIVASLLFFLFRYLKNANIIFPDDGEVWHPNNKSSDTTVSAEDPSPTDNIEEFASSETEEESGPEYNPTKKTKKFTLSKSPNSNTMIFSTDPLPVLATTDEAGIVSDEENHTSVEEEDYYHASVEEEEDDHYHLTQQKMLNEIRHYSSTEEEDIIPGEEYVTVEEEDCDRDGQCKQFVDHKKKVSKNRLSLNKHIGIPDNPDKNTMTPYQSPVNINVSYISKNSVSDSNFAKDDIVTNSKLGTPGSNSYGNSRPSDLNQRLTIDNNNANRNSNSNSNRNSNRNSNSNSNVNNNSNRNNNRNDNRNDNENCIGPNCRGSRPLPVPDEAYTNSGYSYLNPEYQGLDGDTTGGSCNNGKCHVCPMEINQNWSKWKPNYLSGDDTKNNK